MTKFRIRTSVICQGRWIEFQEGGIPMNLDVTYQGPVQRGFNGTHTLSIGIGTLTFLENFTGAR